MGSSQCCLILEIMNYDEFLTDANNQKRPMLMARIFNTTVLQGDDFITLYDGEYQNLLVSFYVKQLYINEELIFKIDANKYDNLNYFLSLFFFFFNFLIAKFYRI
jgi:hypothetical protein